MQSVAYVLSHFVRPFFAGVMMAAVASSTDDPLSIAILFTTAALCGFLSLPVGERLIRRVIAATA